MNQIDLFSGIGGFALGIQQAGIHTEKHYFSEINKYATQIYKKHFPNAVELGDINNINPKELPKIGIITFGFPCQDLSLVGNRVGLKGSRSGLFFKAMGIIRQYLPDIFIFENVGGLLTSDEGKDFEIVLREIADIGLYECEWQLVNTSWVLPQSRERIFFIGHLGEKGGQKVFPITGNGKENNEPIASTIVSTYWKGLNSDCRTGIIEISKNEHQGYRVYDPKEIAITLCGQAGGLGAKTGLYYVDARIRKLTPVECERLQGFPDGWTEGISDTRRYECLGNAVSVPIVKMIMERLF
jgi:DNA (cytosine-5)-methyltransferase 1